MTTPFTPEEEAMLDKLDASFDTPIDVIDYLDLIQVDKPPATAMAGTVSPHAFAQLMKLYGPDVLHDWKIVKE